MNKKLRYELSKFKDDIIVMTRRSLAEQLLSLPFSKERDELIEELRR